MSQSYEKELLDMIRRSSDPEEAIRIAIDTIALSLEATDIAIRSLEKALGDEGGQ